MPWQPVSDDELQHAQTQGWLPAGGGAPGGAGGGTMQGLQAMAQQLNPAGQLQGQDLLNYMERNDPEGASFAKALYEGRAPGTGRNLQQMMKLASAIWPDFDAGVYQGRAQARKSFMPGGKDYGNVRAYSTAIGHATETMKAIDDLHNSQMFPGIINPLWQGVKENLGDAQFQGAKERFERSRDALASELATAFRSQGVAEGDINRWQEGLQTSKSPVELRAGVQQALKLLGSRMETSLGGWNQTFPNRQMTLDDMLAIYSPHAAPDYHRLLNIDPATGQVPRGRMAPDTGVPGPAPGGLPAPAGPQGAGGPQIAPAGPAAAPGGMGGIREGQTATNRQTGQRIIFRNGGWEPLQ
jgi:hypothetical protein